MEKEIEQLLRAMYGDYNEAYNRANAKAIAEKMRKGVVWEGTGQIVHGLNSTSVGVPGAGRLTLEDNWGDARPAVHGQRVRVTVTKVEGMGDGEGD